MLEFKSAVLSTAKKDNTPLNLIYSNGINYLEKEEEFIFRFLSEKEKYLLEGSFFVDDNCFIPSDEASTKSLFFLAINSQNISITTCFVTEKENKQEVVDEVQSRLIELKNLPLDSEEEKLTKIDRIFSTIIKHNVSFILLDANKEINKENIDLIFKILNKYQKETTILVLKNDDEHFSSLLSTDYLEKEFNNYEFLDVINISTSNNKTTKVVATKKEPVFNNVVSSNSNSHTYLNFKYTLNKPLNKVNFLLNYLIKNFVVLFFLVLSLVGFILTFLLSPQYFAINNAMLGIMFISLGCVFFGLFIYNLYSCYDFISLNDKPEVYKQKFIYTTVSAEIVTLLGSLIAIGLYFLFVCNYKDFDIKVFNLALIILAGVGIILGLTFPLLVKQYYRFFSFIKRKLYSK